MSFLNKHRDEIKPLLDNKERAAFSDDKELSEADASRILEKYENKLFYFEKSEHDLGAQSVLLTVNDPGAYNTIKPLISALEDDPRCKAVAVLASGVGGKSFSEEYGDKFKRIRDEKKSILQSTIEMAENKPFDVVLATLNSINDPSAIALYGGKSIFKAKKMFCVADGWGNMRNKFSIKNSKNLDEIDSIFCSDEIAKKIYEHQLAGISHPEFLVTGSPAIDALRVDNPPEFRKQARNTLGIDQNDIVFLFLGDISSESQRVYNTARDVNERTFKKTLESIIKCVESQPRKSFVLLVRPHPRDPNSEQLSTIANDYTLPLNLRLIPTPASNQPMQDARYAADVVMSIASTENFFANRLGRESIFLGYGNNLGGKVLAQVYGEATLKAICDDNPKVHVVANQNELEFVLAKCQKAPDDISHLPIMKEGDSAQHILDKLFELA